MTSENSTGRVTGAKAVVKDAQDPSRRPDVLFRVRRAPGQEANPWWNICAFVMFCGGVLGVLSLLP